MYVVRDPFTDGRTNYEPVKTRFAGELAFFYLMPAFQVPDEGLILWIELSGTLCAEAWLRAESTQTLLKLQE